MIDVEADRMWSLAVRRGQGKCLLSGLDPVKFGGCRGHYEAHHLVKRRDMARRNDPANGACLCQRHHIMAEGQQPLFEQALEALGLDGDAEARYIDGHGGRVTVEEAIRGRKYALVPVERL